MNVTTVLLCARRHGWIMQIGGRLDWDQGAGMTEALQKLRQYLLTGVSYAIPFIACGGILIALSLAFAPQIEGVPLDQSLKQLQPEWARNLLLTMLTIGGTSFGLMLP